MTNDKKIDLFISHAGEDKKDFVAPLAEALKQLGLDVWYDDYELKIGDSLTKEIDKGIANCEYGLVILSPHFIKKGFPDYELRGLLAREIGDRKIILPIWHNLTKKDLLEYSPSIADKFALRSSEENIIGLAIKIIKGVRPDLFTKIVRRIAYLSEKWKSKKVNTKDINLGPIIHKKISSDLFGRIRLIRAALMNVYPRSMQFWVEGFLHDAHPTNEVRIWERIATCFIEYTCLEKLTLKQQKQVFLILSTLSFHPENYDFSKMAKGLPKNAVEKLLKLFQNLIPLYDRDYEPLPTKYKVTKEDEYLMKLPDKEFFPDDIPNDLVEDFIQDNKESSMK